MRKSLKRGVSRTLKTRGSDEGEQPLGGAEQGFEPGAQSIDDVIVAIFQYGPNIAGMGIGFIRIECQFIDGMAAGRMHHDVMRLEKGHALFDRTLALAGGLDAKT